MSIFINANEQFICEDINETKTMEFLRKRYQLSSLGQKTIYKLFLVIRKCISQYYFDVNKLDKLVENNALRNIAIDESLFVHEHEGSQE